jgi:hypothetical protein
MLISAREACDLLTRDGVSRRGALKVLASGLAGSAVRAHHVVLYDEARVAELAARSSLRWQDAEQWSPGGFFVSRREFPATSPRADQVASLSGGWGSVCPWEWLVVALQMERHGPLPFVATVGGLVAFGADIVEVRGFSQLVLEEPGPWFDDAAGCWFPTGPGRPWVLHIGALSREQAAPEKIAG